MPQHTRRTLSLNPQTWDVQLDSVGRISVTQEDLATAQTVANEVRLFTEDAYFIQERGLPHFIRELGDRANDAIVRTYLRRAAEQVPDVLEILDLRVDPLERETRRITGEIQFRTVEGANNGTIRTYF